MDSETEFIRSQYLMAKYGTLKWILKKDQLEHHIARLESLGFRINKQQYLRPSNRRMRSLWEANHIVAVVEGGADCGLDNLETLCLRCHKEKTNELRKKLRGLNG